MKISILLLSLWRREMTPPAWCIDVGIFVDNSVVQDYLRPSVESILQSGLLADAVAQEQKAQARLQRKSAESASLQKPSEPTSVAAAELRLKEQALQEREKALKEREERLERKAFTSAS